MNKHIQKILIILFITFLGTKLSVSAQTETQDFTCKRHFIGSSLFMIANFFPDPADFYQLEYGYWLTPKDAIMIEAKTWKYHTPLGIPYGPSFESPDESYPGSVGAYGVGLGYKRFLWKGLYSSVNATPFLQYFLNPEKEKIQKGFQLFLVLRVGYHLDLFKDRFYLEPSVAFNYWPINTNFPESFAKIESKWPNYFLFEPGLNFGIKF
jgi:hypothetical protein